MAGEKRQELTTGKIKDVLNELYDMNVFNLIFVSFYLSLTALNPCIQADN